MFLSVNNPFKTSGQIEDKEDHIPQLIISSVQSFVSIYISQVVVLVLNGLSFLHLHLKLCFI
ncbi:MAG: hypothetical protein WCG25_08810 [bacterium]